MNGMDLVLARQQDAPEIAEFVCSHPLGEIEHTFEGANLVTVASGGRWTCHLCICREGGRIVGTMPIALAGFKGLRFVVCRSSGGPLVVEDRIPSVMPEMLRWLVEWARSNRCCSVELRMPFPERIAEVTTDMGLSILEATQEVKFARVPRQPGGTYWVELGPEDQMLASMSKKCRRDIRKGQREGVRVEMRTDLETLEEFYRQHVAMCGRKSLPALSEKYVLEGIKPCLDAKLAGVFVASYQDVARNMVLATLTGKPQYSKGTTSEAAFEQGCPPTGQFLQFEVMKFCAGLGRKTYDLGGSPGPVPQQGHPNYGVWRFKHEFQGRWITRLEKFELITSRMGRATVRLGYGLLRWLKRKS